MTSRKRVFAHKVLRYLIPAVLAWGSSCPAVRADNVPAGNLHCIRAGARGNASGRTWKDAFTSLPQKLQRGHIYYVAAGDYSEHRFEDLEDGEKFIIVKKAVETDHGTDEGWQKEYAQGAAKFKPVVFMKSYYIFDGQTGGGPKSWIYGHGFEINIPGGGMGIRILEQAKIPGEVKHIELRHIAATTGDIDVKGAAVYGCTGKYSDIKISYCYFHDLFGVPVHIINWEHLLFEYNCVARNKCTPEWHSEAVASRNCSNMIFRYNWWENIQGTGIIMHMSGEVTDWEVYGNVFYDSGIAPLGLTAHGAVADNQNGSIKRVKVYNNTIVGIRGLSSSFRFFKGAGDIEAYNNLWYKCPAFARMAGVTKQDCNTYIDTEAPGVPGANDKKLKGEDPFVNSKEHDFRLNRPTSPGKILKAPYDKDLLGNTRGTNGTWSRGAFEFSEGKLRSKD